jgi:hypothetical protein
MSGPLFRSLLSHACRQDSCIEKSVPYAGSGLPAPDPTHPTPLPLPTHRHAPTLTPPRPRLPFLAHRLHCRRAGRRGGCLWRGPHLLPRQRLHHRHPCRGDGGVPARHHPRARPQLPPQRVQCRGPVWLRRRVGRTRGGRPPRRRPLRYARSASGHTRGRRGARRARRRRARGVADVLWRGGARGRWTGTRQGTPPWLPPQAAHAAAAVPTWLTRSTACPSLPDFQPHPCSAAAPLPPPSTSKDLAAVCHAAGVPLIVDEAHGGHFGPATAAAAPGALPPAALAAGADAAVQSTHKARSRAGWGWPVGSPSAAQFGVRHRFATSHTNGPVLLLAPS